MVLNAKRSDNTALLVLFIFNSMTFLSHVTFIRLAKEWPSLMESWNFVEKRMQYGRIRVNIRNKVLWKSLRTEHFYLCKLCASINDKLGNLILLSYATNLYLIIIDWFGAARIERSFLKKAHYSMSIIIDTSKLIAVSWYAASVHEENNNVFKCLLSIPSFLYNLEIERFTNQAIFMKCVISGKKLFTITRGTIFKIAGALVTYELVVLQFNTKLIPNYDDEIHYSGTGFNNSFHQSAG
ncbi:gustatory receptor for sugar taste 64f-like [Zophobas morio]|uniref:gustatory receptor for sugar taste 64f-like n=1 Tax=Zophobas morio TaxID=2755281 RepID=UPI003083CB56